MIRIFPLKKRRRKVNVDPKLGGQRKRKEKEKVPTLRSQWEEKEKFPMLGGQWKEKEKEKEKVPMFEGQWNVSSLVAYGR
jgi:hypothetical protein